MAADLTFTRHALDRMAEFGIDAATVIATVRDAGVIYPGSSTDNDGLVHRGASNGYAAVVTPEGHVITILRDTPDDWEHV